MEERSEKRKKKVWLGLLAALIARRDGAGAP